MLIKWFFYKKTCYNHIMTTDTIKEVLGKIMSINRNLNTESLKTLLVASGWDKQDIEDGVKLFEYYSGINQENNTIKTPQEVKTNIQNNIESYKNITTQQENIKNDKDSVKYEKESNIETNNKNLLPDNMLSIDSSDVHIDVGGDKIEDKLQDIEENDKLAIEMAKKAEELKNQNPDQSHSSHFFSDLIDKFSHHNSPESEHKITEENVISANNSVNGDGFSIFILVLNSVIGILFVIFLLYIILI